MKNYFFLWLSGMLLILGGCRKDLDNTIITDAYPIPVVRVKASLGGTIVNENGTPVPNASVFVGTKQTTTDQNGVFLFRDEIVNGAGTYIRVEHPNYFHGSRTINPLPGSISQVRIQLLSNQVTKYINATSGGKADYGDYQVMLPAGGIVTASGGDYSGQVGLAVKWLDPSNPSTLLQMPGRLQGVNTNGQLTGMVTMGMLAVELTDDSGQKLQIKSGFEAEIRSRVPASMLSAAPATIPLWYFDEAVGVWREEGTATLSDGFYSGKVGHFSFWNHDFPGPLVTVKFKVNDAQGNPVSGVDIWVTLKSNNLFGAGHGYTDDFGMACGLVPKGELLNLSVRGLPSDSAIFCSNPLYEAQIGPFNSEDSVCIVLPVPTQTQTYTFSGRLLDCLGQPVVNGYARLNLGTSNSFVIYPDSTGNFSSTLVSCTPIDQATVIGYDLEALKTSPNQSIAIAGGGSYNLGILLACSQAATYLQVEAPGVSHSTIDFRSIFAAGNNNIIIEYGDSSLTSIVGGFGPIASIGTFDVLFLQISNNKVNGPIYHYFCEDQDNPCSAGNVKVTITEFSGVGGYISGTISGSLFEEGGASGVLHPISVSFRALLQ